jgi:hypothetical protein
VKLGLLAFGLLFGTAVRCPSAAAEEPDVAAAEALFQEGRELLEGGHVADACPKLAESHKLDPATGTLIALAACHEKEGRLATAWAEFTEASARAAQESRPDRRDLAAGRAEQLRPRLSSLTVRVSEALANTPGLSIRRAERPLGRGEWNTPLPIDGGSYALEVSAPGKLPWRGSVVVAAEGAHEVVDVPALLDEPKPAPPKPTLPPKKTRHRESPKAPRGLSNLEWLGIGTAGAGVVTLGVGGYFLGKMLSKKEAAGCDGNRCDDDAQAAELRDAVDAGNVATGLGIGGAVLVIAGGSLFFVGRSERSDGPPVAISVLPNGARLSGTF